MDAGVISVERARAFRSAMVRRMASFIVFVPSMGRNAGGNLSTQCLRTSTEHKLVYSALQTIDKLYKSSRSRCLEMRRWISGQSRERFQ